MISDPPPFSCHAPMPIVLCTSVTQRPLCMMSFANAPLPKPLSDKRNAGLDNVIVSPFFWDYWKFFLFCLKVPIFPMTSPFPDCSYKLGWMRAPKWPKTSVEYSDQIFPSLVPHENRRVAIQRHSELSCFIIFGALVSALRPRPLQIVSSFVNFEFPF